VALGASSQSGLTPPASAVGVSSNVRPRMPRKRKHSGRFGISGTLESRAPARSGFASAKVARVHSSSHPFARRACMRSFCQLRFGPTQPAAGACPVASAAAKFSSASWGVGPRHAGRLRPRSTQPRAVPARRLGRTWPVLRGHLAARSGHTRPNPSFNADPLRQATLPAQRLWVIMRRAGKVPCLHGPR
jgi:hypothetical protein